MGIRTKTGWPDKYYSQELERCLAESDSYKEEQRSANDTDSNLGKEERDFDSIGDRWKDVAIIEEIAEMLEKVRKTSYQLLEIYKRRSYQKKILKLKKVLCKFKTHSITKTNELFYAGAAVFTDRLGVKINKATVRKEPM